MLCFVHENKTYMILACRGRQQVGMILLQPMADTYFTLLSSMDFSFLMGSHAFLTPVDSHVFPTVEERV